ncbi:ras-GEF domain-containing family member 1B-like isoform X2 [Paramacrobiotus metropolitanus]|nr:ras-GEF domain-containing family member 1B-like isoform X2 [Paramacrobiotus metropolitanus]
MSLTSTSSAMSADDDAVQQPPEVSADSVVRGSQGKPPLPSPPSKSADIFGIQMEVTNLLLEAERRRLRALQRDLTERYPLRDDNGYGKRELDRQKLYIGRIEQQYQQLLREYEQAAAGMLRNGGQHRKSNRSQPAFGVKYTTKTRPTIFGTLAVESMAQLADLRKNPSSHSSRRWNSMCSLSSSSGTQEESCGSSTDADSAMSSQRSSDQSLIFEHSILCSGTLDALIHHFMPSVDYYPDRTYVFAFLLSSRLFVKPYLLLEQVVHACTVHESLYPSSISAESMRTFCRHIVRLLGEWTDTFSNDFRDERMMKSLKDITHFCITFDPETRRDVGQILQNLLARLSALEKYEEHLMEISQEVANRIASSIPTTDIYDLCPNPQHLAHYLTSIELERLRHIGAEEFVQAFAKDTSVVETPLRDLKRTRNLEAYVQWFNRLSYLVATEICMQLKKRHRVRIMDYFIDVAKECFNLGNFNSLMAIIAGLNMSPVRRLKRTWAKVNVQKFEVLEHQMDPSGNFNSYRSTLKAAMWRSEGASTEREKIIVPFFSLLVKDLYFLNEGCANRLKSGHVNFEKFWQLAKQVTEFLTWKQAVFSMDKNNRVVRYLLTNPVFSESALSLASFECEQPENNYERARNKQLK